MAEAQLRIEILLARVTVAVIITLIALEVIWYGIYAAVHERLWRDISDRPSGPMAFRFLLQPVMAAILAVHDGFKDARLGRSPYFWTVVSDREQRWSRMQEELIATGRVILLGLVMDAIYQFRVFGTFYPGEAVVVALLLAFVPYLMIRGLAARVERRRNRSASGTAR